MKKLSRRNFLKMAGVAAGAAALSAYTPAPEQLSTPPQAKKVEITFMGWGAQAEDEGVRAAIKEFAKVEPNITVTWQHTPDRYIEKLMSMIAAKTPPDTAFVGSGNYQTFCKDNLLLDITGMYKADPVIGKAGYFIEPQEANRCTWKGKWYGFGSCWVAPHIYYNADVFEKEKITPPSNDPTKAWTWDEFLEVCKKLTVDKNGKHPNETGFDEKNITRFGVFIPWGGVQRWTPILMAGGEVFDPQTGMYKLDMPESIDGIQKHVDLHLKHKVAPMQASIDQLGMSTTQMLESGRLAMLVDGSWALSWLTLIKANLGTAAMPKIKTTATAMQAHIHSGFKDGKFPNESFKWLRFLATEYYQLLFCKMGLWLPSQTDLMTEKGMQKWYTDRKAPGNGIHPKGYDLIVNNFVPKYGKVVYDTPGTSDASTTLNPEFDAIYLGQKTAEQGMKLAIPKCNEILKKALAS